MGDETATPLAATLTWLMRHGAGMTGQIAFTWFEGQQIILESLSAICPNFKTYIALTRIISKMKKKHVNLV